MNDQECDRLSYVLDETASRRAAFGVVIGLAALHTQGAGAKKRGKRRPAALAEPGDESANNLSVPALFVPDATGAPPLKFPLGVPVNPSGATLTFPDDFANPLTGVTPGEYFIQGVNDWQASSATSVAGLVVAADLGDNLVNAPLKRRTPIRVELGLIIPDPAPLAMTGFNVVKLTDELDRDATYGTLGTAVTPSPEVRAWDAGARLKIERSDGLVVFDGPFGAEINATGRVVYGYNWQNPAAGDYTLTFSAPNVSIGSVLDEPEQPDRVITLVNEHTVTLTLTVKASAGGKGGGGKGGGGKGSGGKGGKKGGSKKPSSRSDRLQGLMGGQGRGGRRN